MKHGEYLCRGNTTAASMEKTAEHCARQCYNTPTCSAWTFGSAQTRPDDRPTPDNCWLKTTAECKGSNPDWMWGPRECGNLTGSLTSESVVAWGGPGCLHFCFQSAHRIAVQILQVKCKSISPDLVTRCHRMIKSLGGPGYGEPLWYHFYIVNNSVLQPKMTLCLVYTKISWESRTLCCQI